MAQTLQRAPALRVCLRGSQDDCEVLGLALERARAVHGKLVQFHVNAGRIEFSAHPSGGRHVDPTNHSQIEKRQ